MLKILKNNKILIELVKTSYGNGCIVTDTVQIFLRDNVNLLSKFTELTHLYSQHRRVWKYK